MVPRFSPSPTRRQFLHHLGGAGILLAGAPALFALPRGGESARVGASPDPAGAPWFRRTLRWGQTNLTEVDPARIDIAWWRAHWRRTGVQGVVLNAGGIVAYYPTEVPFHRRARDLGERDLFGELNAAARQDGLEVFARMDSNRADENFYRAHPDWFAHDADGRPYVVTGLYVACVNSPYYEQHIPAILEEIVTRYHPSGITDNNWNGPMRDQPCFCRHCEERFRARTGRPLPRTAEWDDPIYRQWIRWNYERRLEIWDHFNQVTRAAGGPDCIWVGMMAGSQNWQARVFRDDREVYRRADLVMLDHQRRFDGEGFQHNAEVAKRIRSVGGWDKVIPESMAMYHLAEHNYRLVAKPVPEVRMWALEGFAGGVQPWWHHVGAEQRDRRMLDTAQPLFAWHRENERYLINRRPVARVGLLWSQRNMDFFGRDEGSALVDDPANGWMQALVRARIPYVPVHLDDLAREAADLDLRLLIMPNLGAISDEQATAVRSYVAAGGNLIATGLTSLCDEEGLARPDFALADVFGVHLPAGHGGRDPATRARWATAWSQTYLRVWPAYGSVGARHAAPAAGRRERHPVVQGFGHTDLLPFGGQLEPLRVDPGADVPLTFVPPVPLSPPESVWIDEESHPVPGLVLRSEGTGGRVAYLPADLDRQFARENLPDQGDLLAALARWAGGPGPLQVQGPGLLDCHLWRQPNRLILHLVNLTSAGTWRTPVHELIRVGPFNVSLELPDGNDSRTVRSIGRGGSVPAERRGGALHFSIESILDHEVLVIE